MRRHKTGDSTSQLQSKLRRRLSRFFCDADTSSKPGRWCQRHRAGAPPELKTIDQVVHERMALRPFLDYERFDTAMFVDYGIMKYDKHENDPDRRRRKRSNGK